MADPHPAPLSSEEHLKRQIPVLGFWCISNCCNACNSRFFVSRASLYLDIFSSAPSQRTCADLFFLYFRAMNTRLIRLLYVEVCFHFLFSGRDWTRVIFHDLGVVSPNPNRGGTKGGHTQGLDATVSGLSSFPRYPGTLMSGPPAPLQMCEDNCQGSRLPDSLMAKPFITFFISYFILLF